jgi:RNA polymerase sigma factor (sigma-70 family)
MSIKDRDRDKHANKSGEMRDKKNIPSIEQCYEHYYVLVRGIAQKITHDRDMAEDIASEVFLKLHVAVGNGSLDIRGNMKSYLATMAKNLAIDGYRRQKKFPMKQLTSSGYASGNFSNRVDERTDAADVLREPLQHLNSRQKEVLYEHHVGGKMFKDIAKEMNIPIGSVQSTVFRAKGILLGHIDKKKLE